MQTILDILKEAVGYRPGLCIKIDNQPFMELVIEAVHEPGPRGLPALSVAHYGEQNGDPSAADWKRFGRLPGFTNCKAKYKRDDGLFPLVRLHSHSGQQFSKAQAFLEEITAAYEARERQREQRRAERVLSPQRGPRSPPSLERFVSVLCWPHRQPAPAAWLTNNMGLGEVETASRFPLLRTQTTAT